MSKVPENIKAAFGIKSEIEIKLMNPVDILIRFSDGTENVVKCSNYIEMLENPIFTSISVGNDVSSMETANTNIKEIIILNWKDDWNYERNEYWIFQWNGF